MGKAQNSSESIHDQATLLQKLISKGTQNRKQAAKKTKNKHPISPNQQQTQTLFELMTLINQQFFNLSSHASTSFIKGKPKFCNTLHAASICSMLQSPISNKSYDENMKKLKDETEICTSSSKVW